MKRKKLLGTCYLGCKGGQREWEEQKLSQVSAPIFIFIVRGVSALSEKMKHQRRRKEVPTRTKDASLLPSLPLSFLSFFFCINFIGRNVEER